jgi:hypothetical protein
MTDDPPGGGCAAAPDGEPGESEDAVHGTGGDAARADDPERTATGELFTQFEVIRRVLEAHRAAEAAGDEPVAGSEIAAVPGSVRRRSSFEAGVGPRAPARESWPENPRPEADTADSADSADASTDPPEGGRRLGLVAAVAALSVFIGGAGAATLYYAGDHGTKSTAAATTADAAASAVPTPQTLAVVSWVLSSVGSSQVVACDVSVCSLLLAHGFPASSIVTVQSVADVEQADVVIVTPVLRRQFGSALDAVVSAEPLAVYGSSSMQVEADAVALTGPSAYATELAADRAGRRTVGAALLSNAQVTFAQQGGTQARVQLSAGLVDTRVCALLATLAAAHSLVIAGFTPPGAGAGPDVPSAGVLVSSVDGTPVSATSPSAKAVLAVVNAQQSPYLALAATVTTYDGAPALRIVFSQPGPLGLLGG